MPSVRSVARAGRAGGSVRRPRRRRQGSARAWRRAAHAAARRRLSAGVLHARGWRHAAAAPPRLLLLHVLLLLGLRGCRCCAPVALGRIELAQLGGTLAVRVVALEHAARALTLGANDATHGAWPAGRRAAGGAGGVGGPAAAGWGRPCGAPLLRRQLSCWASPVPSAAPAQRPAARAAGMSDARGRLRGLPGSRRAARPMLGSLPRSAAAPGPSVEPCSLACPHRRLAGAPGPWDSPSRRSGQGLRRTGAGRGLGDGLPGRSMRPRSMSALPSNTSPRFERWRVAAVVHRLREVLEGPCLCSCRWPKRSPLPAKAVASRAAPAPLRRL